MKKSIRQYLPNTLLSICIPLVAFIWVMQFTTFEILRDPDTYLHIASGNWILSHLSIPRVDIFSYTAIGQPWINHEWLAQCILSIGYQLGSWNGLVFITALMLALTLAIQLQFLLARISVLYAVTFSALTFFSLTTHLLARPHVIAWPLMVIWVCTLLKVSEGNTKPPFWLLLIMLIWANLHASFILGLALIPLLAVNGKFSERLTLSQLKQWTYFGVLSLVASMLTPWGWKGIWLPFHISTLSNVGLINEWALSPLSAVSPITLWLGLIVYLLILRRLKLTFVFTFIIACLSYEALLHGRYISIFGLIAPMLLANAMSSGKLIQNQTTSDARRNWKIFLVTCVLISLSTVASYTYKPHQPDPHITPQQAVDAALLLAVKGNVLNEYNYGGYLEYRGIPVFIDGRAEIYSHDEFATYIAATESHNKEQVKQILNKYEITWTVLNPKSELINYLDQNPFWKKVYEDSISVVHIKK